MNRAFPPTERICQDCGKIFTALAVNAVRCRTCQHTHSRAAQRLREAKYRQRRIEAETGAGNRETIEDLRRVTYRVAYDPDGTMSRGATLDCSAVKSYAKDWATKGFEVVNAITGKHYVFNGSKFLEAA